MGRKGRSGRIPKWYKGRKFLCDIGGEEIYEDDGSLFRQRGLNVSRQNFDSLTDEERAENIKQIT